MRPVDSELPPMRPSSQFEFETPDLIQGRCRTVIENNPGGGLAKEY